MKLRIFTSQEMSKAIAFEFNEKFNQTLSSSQLSALMYLFYRDFVSDEGHEPWFDDFTITRNCLYSRAVMKEFGENKTVDPQKIKGRFTKPARLLAEDLIETYFDKYKKLDLNEYMNKAMTRVV